MLGIITDEPISQGYFSILTFLLKNHSNMILVKVSKPFSHDRALKNPI